MSKDKYPIIFLKPNGDYCAFFLQIFFATRIWGFSPDIPVLAGPYIFSHVMRLDQSPASKNI